MKKFSLISVLMLLALSAIASAANSTEIRVRRQPRTQSDGGPIATCRPGANCNPNDNVRQVASDGGPIATCRPGANCNPNDNVRQVASDGGPIATCRLGVNCNPDNDLRLLRVIKGADKAEESVAALRVVA